MPTPWPRPRAATRSLAGYLRAHLERCDAGDYFALLAYIEMNDRARSALAEIASCGARPKARGYLSRIWSAFPAFHRQAYKGGPNSGVFLQITCDDAADLPVPGQKYTFGVVKAAQARGDFQVLAERGRRALRVHLGKDLAAGLERLAAAFHQALT